MHACITVEAITRSVFSELCPPVMRGASDTADERPSSLSKNASLSVAASRSSSVPERVIINLRELTQYADDRFDALQ